MGDRKIILDTLAYSAIFSSPLTEDELYSFLHTNVSLARSDFSKKVIDAREHLVMGSGYITLKGKESLIKKRVGRRSYYDRKIRLAQKGARILSFIPTIYFIGLTGSVASGNPGDDDIDFFIVTNNRALLVSRFVAVILLSILGIRRKKHDRNVKDKICLNMFCDISGMDLFTGDKNIYIAREIAQMVPLFDRAETYKKFLEVNSWTRKFTANAGRRKALCMYKNKNNAEISLSFFEPLLKIILGTNTHAFIFYPRSTKATILKKYKAAGGLL